jgi:hypothetical protein
MQPIPGESSLTHYKEQLAGLATHDIHRIGRGSTPAPRAEHPQIASRARWLMTRAGGGGSASNAGWGHPTPPLGRRLVGVGPRLLHEELWGGQHPPALRVVNSNSGKSASAVLPLPPRPLVMGHASHAASPSPCSRPVCPAWPHPPPGGLQAVITFDHLTLSRRSLPAIPRRLRPSIERRAAGVFAFVFERTRARRQRAGRRDESPTMQRRSSFIELSVRSLPCLLPGDRSSKHQHGNSSAFDMCVLPQPSR